MQPSFLTVETVSVSRLNAWLIDAFKRTQTDVRSYLFYALLASMSLGYQNRFRL